MPTFIKASVVAAAVVLGGCGLGNPGPAAVISAGPPAPIPADTEGHSFTPQVVMDAAGRATAVWIQAGLAPSGTRTICSSRHDPASGWDRPQVAAIYDSATFNPPVVAGNDTGHVVMVWEKTTLNTGVQVLSTHFQPGIGWGPTTAISDFATAAGTSSAGSPRVAIDAAGRCVAVWFQFNSGGPGVDIWFNRLDPRSGWGLPQRIPGASGLYPALAMNASGAALALWSGGSAISGSRFDFSAGWSVPVALASTAGGIGPLVLAMNSSGRGVALWSDNGLLSSRFDPASGWDPAVGVAGAPDPGIYDHSLDIALNESGSVIVAWVRDHDLWAARRTGGAEWTDPDRLETGDPGRPGRLEIAINEAGNAVAVWDQMDWVRSNIRFNRHIVGSGWQATGQVESDYRTAYEPCVAVPGNSGALMAVWLRRDGVGATPGTSPWSSRFEAGGGWEAPLSLEGDIPVSNPELTGITVTSTPVTPTLGEPVLVEAVGSFADGSSAPVEVVVMAENNLLTGSVGPYDLGWMNTFWPWWPVATPGLRHASQTGMETVTVVAVANPDVSATLPVTLTLNPDPLPTITTSAYLPYPRMNFPYSATLACENGSGPRFWEVVEGSLPPGLALEAATGILSGTPDWFNTTGFRIRVTDDAGSDFQDFLIQGTSF